jgi:hypothetical protein
MDLSKHIRPEDIQQLEANWTAQQPVKGTRDEIDHRPVIKLFVPWAGGTWLVTEKEPGSSLAFGLADLGYPEMGYICLEELFSIRGPGGLTVEQDIHFRADKPLSEYAAQARKDGYIRA